MVSLSVWYIFQVDSSWTLAARDDDDDDDVESER